MYARKIGVYKIIQNKRECYSASVSANAKFHHQNFIKILKLFPSVGVTGLVALGRYLQIDRYTTNKI